MAKRKRISSGAPWESIIGYSRAIRTGNVVYVAGTTATDASGELVGEGDAYAQTAQALDNIRRALEQADARMEDVVRVRYFVTDISSWEEVGRAHAEELGSTRPVATMVQVVAMIDARMLVEVEAEAVVDPS